MSEPVDLRITNRWILSQRGGKNPVDPLKPVSWLTEDERTPAGNVEHTAVIFLANRECPYRCLICDLWKNTTDAPVAPGSIPAQIGWALARMPAARHIKLYNSGSFFDGQAIPREDYGKIASLVGHFNSVLVESHPRLISDRCLHFRDLLKADLQVAMGLETVNTQVLRRLNKKMTLPDFQHAVRFLSAHGILTRAFILLRPPFLNEQEGIQWARKSIDFAFDAGVECCVVIPVREGNGAMDRLREAGLFGPPDIRSLEEVAEYGISLHRGRVFADTWDIGRFASCRACRNQRINRLVEMNLTQRIPERIVCGCNSVPTPGNGKSLIPDP